MKKNETIISTFLDKTFVDIPHVFCGYYNTTKNKIEPIYHKKYYNVYKFWEQIIFYKKKSQVLPSSS